MTQAELVAYNARRALFPLPNERISSADPIADGKESALHQAIKDECKRRGWIALHGSMAHRAHRTIGEPDFVILATDGRTLLVEAKTRSTKPTKEQAALIAWARKLGHTAHVVRSVREFVEVCDG